VYIFIVLLVADFLVSAKSENKHISFHLMYFRQIRHSPIIVTEQGVRGNRSGCTAIVSRLTAREPALIGVSTVRPLLGFSWRDWGIGLLAGENRRFCAVSMNWNRWGRGACVGFYVGFYGYACRKAQFIVGQWLPYEGIMVLCFWYGSYCESILRYCFFYFLAVLFEDPFFHFGTFM